MDVDSALDKIDSLHYAEYVSEMVLEISNGNQTRKAKALELMILSIRWALLIDIHAETADPAFLDAADAQVRKLLSSLPVGCKTNLVKARRRAEAYFEFEKELRKRLEIQSRFSTADIQRYLWGKSSDCSLYGIVLRSVTREWNLTGLMRLQTMLSDVWKDLRDYEEDVPKGFPNVLSLMISGRLGVSRLPYRISSAMVIADQIGASDLILDVAKNLRKKAVSSPQLRRSPTMRYLIEHHYAKIAGFLSEYAESCRLIP